jgi:hypothetical protein
MSIATAPAITKKGGKGVTYGVVSEVSAFFHVKPGHADALRGACERFHQVLKKCPQEYHIKFGLRDMRHVIFDNDTRLCWITAFDTDWDPYIDDPLNTLGLPTWIDWFQHCEEFPDGFERYTNDQVKAFIQSAQVRAAGFFRTVGDMTMTEIRKGQRARTALEKVIDAPGGPEALAQPVLQPLLDEAAD